jgi:hypothetical protein
MDDEVTSAIATPEESKPADSTTLSQCPASNIPSSLEETVMEVPETSVTALNGQPKSAKSEPLSARTTDLVEPSRVDVTTTEKDSKKTKGLSSRPSHILMALSVPLSATTSSTSTSPSSSSSSPSLLPLETESIQNEDRVVEISRLDPRIQRDYISKRKRAYEDVSSNNNSSSTSVRTSSRRDAGYSTSSTVLNVWDGVSKVERLLVQCCERLPDDRRDNSINNDNNLRSSTNNSTNDGSDEDDDDDDDEGRRRQKQQQSLGGVLAVENEVRFAALLASHCHSMASKSLALAILERTLEAYLVEAYIQQKNDEEELTSVHDDEDDDDDKDINMEVVVGNGDRSSSSHIDQQDKSDFIESGMSIQSSRFTRVQQRHERVKAEGKSDTLDLSLVKEGGNGGTPSEKYKRFELFFAAGGLKILNQWLADASSYEVVPFKSASSSSSAAKTTAPSTTTAGRERKASSTRPIILTVLRFLEHIPFDKKVVLNSKINKQIHRLGKRVAAVLDDISDGVAKREDIENWTTEESVTESVALLQTREAVDAVKASWLEKTKNSHKGQQQSETVVDPFESAKTKIRERMEILARFQNGEIPQPEWYQPPVVVPLGGKKKKLNTQELAAQERKAEREKLQKKIELVQSQRLEKLEQLRERLRQKKEKEWSVVAVPAIQSKGTKRVAWKDGLTSPVIRNRQLLEEVFVFIKDSVSAEDNGEGIEDIAAVETSTDGSTEASLL